jgi:putative endonuclease
MTSQNNAFGSGMTAHGCRRVSPRPKAVAHTGMKHFFVYTLASKRNGTLYIGITSDLKWTVYEHKNDLVPGFTARYKTHYLVYYELYYDAEAATRRERQMKRQNRRWKLNLIEENNPDWKDLYDRLL